MFTKMWIRLKAQVLSHSVAAGITTLARLNHLPMEAISTATFIENMAQLFNALNSSPFLRKQKFRHEITNDSGHIELLKQMNAYLKELHVPDKRQVRCISGWRISINSIVLLWHHLHTQFKFRFLLTNRLNQDCVKNLFSVIGGKGGKRDNPDAREFRAAYRQFLFDHLCHQRVAIHRLSWYPACNSVPRFRDGGKAEAAQMRGKPPDSPVNLVIYPPQIATVSKLAFLDFLCIPV